MEHCVECSELLRNGSTPGSAPTGHIFKHPTTSSDMSQLEIMGFSGTLSKPTVRHSHVTATQRQCNGLVQDLACVLLAAGYDVRLNGKYQRLDYQTGVCEDDTDQD